MVDRYSIDYPGLHEEYPYMAKNEDGEYVEHADYLDALTSKGLSIKDLARASRQRQPEFDPDGLLDAMFFAVEMGGECGEALNVVKKLQRERLGIAGSRSSMAALAGELSDVVICAVNLANSCNIDLASAITQTFNATSDKLGLKSRL